MEARDRDERSVWSSAAAAGAGRDPAIQDREASGHRHLSRQLRRLRRGPLRAARTVGLRQVDPAQGGRRLHGADRGQHAAQGPADPRAGRRPRVRVPGVRPAAAVEDGQAERDVRARSLAQDARQGRRGAGHALHREGQSRQVRQFLSAHAVGRHEAARRHRARAGHGARRAADGRAVRGARRADAPQDAGRAAAAVGRHALHGAVRDPLDSRGRADRQPHPAALAASGPGEGRAQQRRQRSDRSGDRTQRCPTASTTCCSRIASRSRRSSAMAETACAGNAPAATPSAPPRIPARHRGERRHRRGAEAADALAAAGQPGLAPESLHPHRHRRRLGALRAPPQQPAAGADASPPRSRPSRPASSAATSPRRWRTRWCCC